MSRLVTLMILFASMMLGEARAQDTPLQPQGGATSAAPAEATPPGAAAAGATAGGAGAAPPLRAPTAIKPVAKLHNLATHDATYWGLPALAGILGLVLGTVLHQGAVRAQAAKAPKHETGLLALWGVSGAVHLLGVAVVGALFMYWALSDTSTQQLYNKHLPWPYVWLAVAFVVPIVFWIATTMGGAQHDREQG